MTPVRGRDGMVEKTARGSRTRQTLIQAALEVFGRRGYAQATTREIAQLAGVAEGTIYRHFPDKQALFHAVFVEAASGPLEQLRLFPDRAGTATLRDSLADLLDLLGSMQEVTAPLMASLAADEVLAESFAAHVSHEGLEQFDPATPMTVTAAYVAAEQRLGRIRDDLDPAEAAALIAAVPLAQGIARTLGVGAARLPASSARSATIEILARGLAP
jgi:AcrR family transcriptional regulator